MIYPIFMLLALFGFPVASVVLCQKLTRSHWNILLFALGAFAVNYLLQQLLDPLFTMFLERAIPRIRLPYQVMGFLPWIVTYFFFGMLREGTRWTILRYAATNVRSWHDGIMFGIAYGSAVMVVMIGQHVYATLEHTGLFTPTLELLVRGGSKPSFNEIVEALRNGYFWQITLLLILAWGVSSMAFNVGTCLAVVFSVQRRSVFYYLAAVALFVVYSSSKLVVLRLGLIGTPPHWLHPLIYNTLVIELGVFVFALPCLLLVFLLRKPMSADT